MIIEPVILLKTKGDIMNIGKFINNNWFRLVIIGFMVVFTYQLNEIQNDMRYIDSDDKVTVDYISKDAMRQLEKLIR